MYKLYHHPICPFSRKVRIHLAAKKLKFELVQENFWQRRREFVEMNPTSKTPILVDDKEKIAICDVRAITEYIEEKHQEGRNFIGDNIKLRAESRRLQAWFNEKFYNEVLKYTLNERFFYRYFSIARSPDTEIIRIARQNSEKHFQYIEKILDERKYLAGKLISVADFAATAQISLLDYFGDVNWLHYPLMKEWYSTIKSQKLFSAILEDRLSNLKPCEWYNNLDF
ncbi:glutathione S-transferase family protein [Rickettsiales bacterium]|nr:glutathione S-transferase family protein [Rickettsiales bacterium]